MKKSSLRMLTALVFIIALAAPAFAEHLDDYYRAAFGQQPGSALEKAVLSATPEAAGAPHCGTPLKHGLSRDWNKLEPATQKALAKEVAAPTLPNSVTSSGGHFTIHYTASGTGAPDIDGINTYTGLGLTSTAAWANKVGDAFETAYTYYSGLGYHMPPNIPYDVYLISLTSASEYGVTTDITRVASSGYPYASSSFIEIDKDFTDPIFRTSHGGPYTPLQSLQITSAHEFHHAIQYGYNFYFDIWYAEATSTWFEDELYDGVNQNYNYLAAWFNNSNLSLDTSVSLSNGGGYGRWIFNRYLAENHTAAVIRSFWEKLAPLDPASHSVNSTGDIDMAPVLDSVLSASYNGTLGADFLGFAKRTYTRDWSSHSGDIGKIPTYSPATSYSFYPVNSASVVTPSVTLPHYSFAYYKFTPSGINFALTIAKTSGIKATLFKKVGGNISEVAANNIDGTSYSVSGFSSLNPAADEVTLLLANTTDVDNHQANFSTDGSSQPVTEPTGGSVYKANGSNNNTGTSSSSGGGGCFIATAAYGSYLHPHVQQLRHFRDEFLLTNAPGRSFVALYYRTSPPLADFISRHPFLRGVARLLLTPLVVVVAHPPAAALFLLLIIGAVIAPLLRRIVAARSHAHASVIHTPSSRF